MEDGLPDDIAADPFFAELLGGVIVRRGAPPALLRRAYFLNPLALFHALRECPHALRLERTRIVGTIDQWLADPTNFGAAHRQQCWTALAALAETDGPEVISMVRKIPYRSRSAQIARLRNGDVAGGIEMCLVSDPGVRDPLRDRYIEHSKHRFGDHLIHALGQLLRRDDLDEPFRVGLLRFAGHLGDSKLGTAVVACWSSDTSSEKRLGDYLWAFARTCEAATAADYLEPVCAAWAALPENGAVDDLCRAFQHAIPYGAIDYFIGRAQLPDLQWRITYMLHAIDDPRVITFIVTELARQPSSYANNLVSDHWRRAQESDRRMSAATRRQLLGIWQDKSENPRKRVAAFDLWAATKDGGDLPVLQAAAHDIDLADRVLAQRRDLGDRGVVPDLVKKIRDRERGRWWWFHADRVWTSELAETLDYVLDCRRDHIAQRWGSR